MRLLITALRLVAGLSASASFCSLARAGNDSNAVKAYGLTGTWSADCSKDVSQQRVSRIAFAADGATATAQNNNGEGVVTTAYQIAEATTIGDDKIGVSFHPVTVTRWDGKPATQHEYDNLHIVFQKAGDKIEVTRIQWEGLPEIEWAVFFEKCLK